MSDPQPIQPAPRPAPPTPQEIERKLGSPSLPPPLASSPGAVPLPNLSTSLESSASQPGTGLGLLERRGSGAQQRRSSVISTGTSTGDEDPLADEAAAAAAAAGGVRTSPPHRPLANLPPLSSISEAEDAVASGSDDAESDTSSLGGARQQAQRAEYYHQQQQQYQQQYPSQHEHEQQRSPPPPLEPIRTSRDSGGLSENVALKSGYLMKKGERRKAWKKRWFVLRGGQLAMYKSDKEYRLLRLIPLTDIHTVAPVELKKHAHAFGIVTPKRTYYVTADSDADVTAWCRLIERAKHEYLARTTINSVETPTAGQTPVPGASPAQTPRQLSFSSAPPPPPARPLASPTAEGSQAPYFSSATQAINIPGSSAPQVGGAFVPASYASTLSSSLTSSAAAPAPAPAVGSGAYAPPNSLVTHAPTSGFGSLELSGLDARLEQMDLASLDSAPPPGRPPPPVRRASGRSDSLAPPPGGGSESGRTPRARSASNATGYSSSAAGHGAVSGSGGGAGTGLSAVSSSEDEGDLGFDPGATAPAGQGLAPPVPQGEDGQQQYMVPSAPQQQQQLPPADPNKVILAGYLMKQGKRKTWRKRWFVLQSGMLMYSRSHMDNKFNRQIPLASILDAIEYEAPPKPGASGSSSATGASSSPPSQAGGTTSPLLSPSSTSPPAQSPLSNAHAFKIITPKRTYLVCAPSEEDEIKWLAALQYLVARRTQQQVGTGGGSAAAAPAPASAPAPAPPKRSPSQTTAAAARPAHGRNRSVTDAARQAVRDVERRFHPAAPGAAAGVA
ncbi:PH domain-containing protein [Rhodotorula paludigena]|uniref:PH domain-containing protein n=1 Tax=Rhodotorula paludigena TaxID=86838 RepID=UPI00317CE219